MHDDPNNNNTLFISQKYDSVVFVRQFYFVLLVLTIYILITYVIFLLPMSGKIAYCVLPNKNIE